jgi:uncharacterized phage protein gp47/JayE
VSTYGVTPTGFVVKPLDAILGDLQKRQRATFGEGINLEPQSNISQLNAPFAEAVAEVWQLGEAVYNARFPDSSTGVSLVNVCSITGTVPKEPTYSRATLIASGNAGTSLQVGRVVSVAGAGTKFQTTEAATLALVSARAPLTVYAAGSYVSNSGRVYVATTGGTTQAGAVTLGTGLSQADGSVTWRFLGNGSGVVTVPARAQDFGPKAAVAGTLSVIETPVAGWSAVVNLVDATLGRDLETDPELRVRRELELRGQGKAALEAVRQDVLAVEGVSSCLIFENDTDVTVDGVPPHSFEALVTGGDDNAIRAAIFASKGCGIRTHGNVSGTVTDSSGQIKTVMFSRPVDVPIYVSVEIAINNDSSRFDGSVFPSNGIDQVKAAIAQKGASLGIGRNVRLSNFTAPIEKVPGVVEVLSFELGLTASTSAANITIDPRERASFHADRIAVTTSIASEQ